MKRFKTRASLLCKLTLIVLFIHSFMAMSISANANDNTENFNPNATIQYITVAEYNFTTGTETTYSVPYRTATLMAQPPHPLVETKSNPRVIIDEDEELYNWSFIPDVRYNSTPFRSVCSLYAGGRSTAFIVGKKTLMTAAHCVYSSTYGGWDTEAFALPHAPSGSTSAYIRSNGTKVLKAIIPAAFKTNPVVSNDWAILIAEDDVGTANGIFTFDTSARTTNEEIVTIGYPIEGVGGIINAMHESPGRITNIYSNYFKHSCDTSSGNSGSPVLKHSFVNGVDTYRVVGIHHGGNDAAQYNLARTADTILVQVVNYFNDQYS